MKRALFKGIPLMLTLILILGIFPISALAANNEDVLTSVSHTSAVSAAVNAENNTVTLTVPYAYEGNVDLSVGLYITYDTSVYAFASTVFPEGAAAVVGGGTVKMLITYRRINDAAQYTSEYAVSVVRAAPTPPTFSGTIAKSVSLPNIITFTAADFSEKYVNNDGSALGSIVINGSDPSFGSLKLGNSTALGKTITVADLQNGSLTFVPNHAGTVSYTVSAYASGTAAYVGTVILTITVIESSNAGVVAYTTDENTPINLKSIDFSSSFYLATGKTLSYVKFILPAFYQGTLYYNYKSGTVFESAVSAETKYYSNAYPNISYITFVPGTGFSGPVSIPYTGYSTDGYSYSGMLTITVNGTDIDGISYTADKNTPISFSASQFSAVCTEVTGWTLSYVKFTLPASTYGRLYYNYRTSTDYDSIATSESKYYNSAEPYLSNVDFMPAADFTGTFSITYTAYDIVGNSYSGKVNITIKETAVDSIVYNTDVGIPVSFKAPDFNAVCAKITGWPLSYVSFTLPVSAGGKLYYNYRTSTDFDYAVAAGAKYYYSAEPNLTNVDFVPAAGFTGTVKISYTGYNTVNVGFSGEITVHVGKKDDSEHFHDVGKNVSWAIEAIDYLYEHGILTGNGAGYYNPQASISKGDFMLILCRAFDLKSDFRGNFSDVDEDDYFYNAVGIGKGLGIAKGSNGKFNPRSALSRQDAMVLIVRALEASGIDLPDGTDSDLRPFKDKNKMSDYAKDAFAALIKAGIIVGSGKALNPNSSVSRAEIAVIIYRVLTMYSAFL
ncbi:MAG: S-layer homology domain-containing protein [Clostridiales bacterium]|nr:S-layer homology domain-containing protein [Clostridiales bacterium]